MYFAPYAYSGIKSILLSPSGAYLFLAEVGGRGLIYFMLQIGGLLERRLFREGEGDLIEKLR